MSFPLLTRVVAMLCIAAATATTTAALAADSPPPGTYVRTRATGTLQVEAESVAKGASVASNPFTLETIGANGHSCKLNGFLSGGVGVVALKSSGNTGSTVCTIAFKPQGSGWAVEAAAGDQCRSFCGVRADFDGRYAREPAGCSASARRASQANFDKLYKAADYTTALPVLTGLRSRCSEVMTWVENDRARNDIAVTQFHLGQFALCLATLKLTYAATLTDDAALKEALPPVDYDTYAPVAKSTWFNQEMCRNKR